MTPKQITALRKKLGLTKEAFATLVGVSYFTIYRWETGKRIPSSLALRRLEALKNEQS